MIRACPSCGAKNRIPEERLDQKASCGRCKTSLLPLAEPMELTSTQAFDDLVSSSPLPVLVDFWAPWCGPCRAVAPELRKIAQRYAGKIVVAKVDTDSLPELAARYDVRGVPNFALFRGGRVASRMTGAGSAAAISSQLGL